MISIVIKVNFVSEKIVLVEASKWVKNQENRKKILFCVNNILMGELWSLSEN